MDTTTNNGKPNPVAPITANTSAAPLKVESKSLFDLFRERLTAYQRQGAAALLRMSLVSMGDIEELTQKNQKLILSTGEPIETVPGELWLRVANISEGAAYQTKGGGHRIVLARASQYAGKTHDVTESAKTLGLYMPKVGGAPCLAISVGGLFVTTIPGTVEEVSACKSALIPTTGGAKKGDVEVG